MSGRYSSPATLDCQCSHPDYVVPRNLPVSEPNPGAIPSDSAPEDWAAVLREFYSVPRSRLPLLPDYGGICMQGWTDFGLGYRTCAGDTRDVSHFFMQTPFWLEDGTCCCFLRLAH